MAEVASTLLRSGTCIQSLQGLVRLVEGGKPTMSVRRRRMVEQRGWREPLDWILGWARARHWQIQVQEAQDRVIYTLPVKRLAKADQATAHREGSGPTPPRLPF